MPRVPQNVSSSDVIATVKNKPGRLTSPEPQMGDLPAKPCASDAMARTLDSLCQLDLESQIVNRVGMFKGFFVTNQAALIKSEQRLIKGLIPIVALRAIKERISCNSPLRILSATNGVLNRISVAKTN